MQTTNNSTMFANTWASLAKGGPLAEARTRGRLVIASDLPALLKLGDEGVLFFPKTSVEMLINLMVDHPSLDWFAQIAPMQIFSWKESAEQLSKALYFSLNECGAVIK